MNALTDILCDTASLLASQNYKASSENRLMPSQEMFGRSGTLSILDSTSHVPSIERPMPSINSHSSPSSIDLFNSTNQIHIAQAVEAEFDDRSESIFLDPFAEIVPSWLTHDFMKVSDNLPSPSILSNVSDIYSSAQEDEHLEMLDLGFTSDLSSHDLVGHDLNRNCIDDSQKLLSELPIQRFSNHGPLFSSLNDINVSHLHMPIKNNINFEKFKHSAEITNTSNLMSTVLNCENDLVHLPIHSNIAAQCLTTSSSPTLMHSSQSHNNSVTSVCDKLPQINLNHNSLVNNNMSDMQLLHQEFPDVNLANATLNHSNHNLNNCISNNISISSGSNSLINKNIHSLPKFKDASVQVADEGLTESRNCISCCKIGLEASIEVTQCYKCKFCDFISIHKCYVQSHINAVHSTPFSIANGTSLELTSNDLNPPLCTNNTTESSYINSSGIVGSAAIVTLNSHLNNSLLSSESTYIPSDNPVISKSSFVSGQSVNSTPVQLSIPESVPLSYQLIPINGVVVGSAKASTNENSQYLVQNFGNNLNPNPRPILKKTDEVVKKPSEPKKISPKSNKSESTTEKSISAQKKGWRKKIRRELGSYICEFKKCNVRFKALDNLEYHRKCHVSGGSMFACPECEKPFNNWSSIAGHLWRNHSNDMELHACDVCSFRTYKLSVLENYHKKTHLDECLFLCDTCGKKFKNHKQLRNHRVIHNKNREKKSSKRIFKCKLCLSSFTSKSLFHSHQDLVHNLKVKNFQCSYCEFSTFKKANMTLHVRQHTGEKPFQCDKCEYRSSDHNSLRRHKMIHSGEKHYKCPFCPYSSIQANSYKDHLKNKHPGQNLIFSCKLCSFRTVKSETYNKHMEEHENINKHKQLHQMNDITSSEEMLPLVEAMGIRLTNGDNPTFLNSSGINQSYINNINMNMMLVCQGNSV